MQKFWDARYAEQEYAYGKEPNLFFQQTLAQLTPGRILLPAEGEGRNAVHAAVNGWKVEAYDYSRSGQIKALQLASEQGVSISYNVIAHDEVVFPPQSFDALGLIFAHLHQDQRPTIHRKLIEMLAPGGTLFLEAFSKDQLHRGTGGPSILEMLYSTDELRDDFKGLAIINLEQIETLITEGKYHSGPASVIRLMARSV